MSGPSAKSLKPPFGADDRFPDVRFRPGEISVLIGGDGAGKSAMLRLLAEPGGDLTSKDIGYQPSTSGTWPQLMVRENLDFVAGLHRIAPAAARARADTLIRAAQLDGAEDRLAVNLSGGMRQKLGVIMAMLPSPSLLILDEPTTGVDVDARASLWELMALSAGEGAIVVVSTTYLDEAERAAQVVFLDHGEVIAAGTPNQVIVAAPGRVDRLLDDGPAANRSALQSAVAGVSWRRGHSCYRWLADERKDTGDKEAEEQSAGRYERADMDLELATIAYLLDREAPDAQRDGDLSERVAVRQPGTLLVAADGATSATSRRAWACTLR